MHVLRECLSSSPTDVLLIHAPYPGSLKFQGVPSSLFAAIGPYVSAHGSDHVTYLDPLSPSDEFYSRLEMLLTHGAPRVLCISTSTAAIEETARIASLARRLAPQVLVIVGGPHEDAIDRKAATVLSGVHLSIAGDAALALQQVLELFLDRVIDPEEFLRDLPQLLSKKPPQATCCISTRAWSKSFQASATYRPDLTPHIRPEQFPSFDVFPGRPTIPLMVSRGCSYGQCTFCSEARPDGRVSVASDFEWIEKLADSTPSAAFYFQDSIFPGGAAIQRGLLPLLSSLGRPWGCQVYLPTLTERRIAELADYGCTYLYTGIESGASRVLHGLSKPGLNDQVVLETASRAFAHGLTLGVSLIFGAIDTSGSLLEDSHSLRETNALASRLTETGVTIAGFYPNILTVLPGTPLDTGLRTYRPSIDFYSMPREPLFRSLEDGEIGYNFLSLDPRSASRRALAEELIQMAARIAALPQG